MRVYLAERSDPMITDTVAGLNSIAQTLREFIVSAKPEVFLPADTGGTPAPYERLLPGLSIEKSDGPLRVSLEPTLGLRVVGSVENLSIWCSHFQFPATAVDGDHHHPEHVRRNGYFDPTSLSVIIEVQEPCDAP